MPVGVCLGSVSIDQDGKLHDVNILDQLVPEAGAFYVMDRGYIDFERTPLDQLLTLSAPEPIILASANQMNLFE